MTELPNPIDDPPTCPDTSELDDRAVLALSLLAHEIADATTSGPLQLWTNSIEDRLLGYDDDPGLGLEALSVPELCAVHPIVVTAAAACGEKTLRTWLIELGAMIERELDRRTVEQMMVDAQLDAHAAEEMRRERENRPPENLDGLQSWSRFSAPEQRDGE